MVPTSRTNDRATRFPTALTLFVLFVLAPIAGVAITGIQAALRTPHLVALALGGGAP